MFVLKQEPLVEQVCNIQLVEQVCNLLIQLVEQVCNLLIQLVEQFLNLPPTTPVNDQYSQRRENQAVEWKMPDALQRCERLG
jgi:hypothetical protein